MNTINISKQELVSLLEEAYQEGVFGYCDLKESYCKSKAEKLFEKSQKSQPSFELTPDQGIYTVDQGQRVYCNWATGGLTNPQLSLTSNEFLESPYYVTVSADSSNEGHINFT